MTEDITLSTAWVHGFRNSLQGGVAEFPGASAKFDSQTDSIIAGLNISFGGKRRGRPAAVGGEGGPESDVAQ